MKNHKKVAKTIQKHSISGLGPKRCEKCEKVRKVRKSEFFMKNIENLYFYCTWSDVPKSCFLQNFENIFAKIAFSQNHCFSYRKSMILEVIFALFALLRKSAKSCYFLAQVEKQ